ncbi:MAG: M28 family peptidase [Actinobacteria bacterium]|nr:M28 family peptidase [Actinomycetota bacterium]
MGADPGQAAGLDRRTFLAGAAATGTALLVGCSTGSDGGPASTTTSSVAPAARPGLDGGGVPDEATIHGWIERIVEQGIRRPGYPADEWTTDFVEDRFGELGLVDVHREPVAVTRWEPHRWSLVATPDGGDPVDVGCWPIPYGAPTAGLDVELRAHDADDPDAVRGAAALVATELVRLPATAAAAVGVAPDEVAGRVHDPDGTLAEEEHVLPHTGQRNRILEPVVAAGAAAFIGSVVDYPIDTCRYFVPYNGEPSPIPGVWIAPSDARWLQDRLAEGPVRVHLEVDAERTEVETATVVGDLAGADDQVVIVGSHHDGPWASAVEDASGVALVLAQASYWAAQPVEDRPHRLRFVLNGGHMCGAAGLRTYLATHADELDDVVLEVHLEHAALDAEERDGELVALDRCVPRWFFTSRISELEDAVMSAITTEDLRRSMIVAPTALGQRPPTDGGAFADAGVPIVQFLAAPWYLFDEVDTIDKVDRSNLVALTRAAARIVGSTQGRSAADLRSDPAG